MTTLSIVATPIGNLEDITLRALRILREADIVLCEDTRVTKKLLDHYEISTPTISYHHHSGLAKVEKILEALRAGKKVALVTDAGTPGVADPGGRLIAEVLNSEISSEVKIESIPGASALTVLLAISGIATDKFLFLGFPPHKKGRQTFVKEALKSEYPVVLYESKYRVIKLFQELAINGEREIIVGRELTKLFEEVCRGTTTEVLNLLKNDVNKQKGEFVVIVKPLEKRKIED
ncbi:MAG: 16S rRNA (cytidine(1402)-2'-O)-methyltransferase [Planctomycetes bacterium]|jgi:16S rRNA (cytidine1402-2'-O)-methyltransferase|nr:16S rRNA (cytidine(1402)-2'-O)-methyltransferase [Planctomycetota bacterium]